MTAPARTQQQQAATPLVDLSLIDRVIEQTVNTQAAHKRLASFIPKGQSYDRIAAQVRESMIKVPRLAECDPDSIINAVVTIQRWQLEIGETAYLVPYGKQCTPVRGYIGDIEMLINNGVARRVDAFCVYSREPFTYREGTSPLLEHQPLAPSQRGELIGAYAILWQTFTNNKAVFLYKEEIEEIRENFSKQWNERTVGELPTWYAKKCAVKAVTKLLPKTPKVRGIIEQMQEDEIIATSATRAISTARPLHITDDGEDLSESEAENTVAAVTPKPKPAATATPSCPKCDGAMWDNRQKKASGEFKATAPDFSCKDKACGGKVWPKKENGDHNTQGEIPGMDSPAPRAPNALAQP